MPVLFVDSFDHYDTADVGLKYDAANSTIINTTVGVPRTGRGCAQLNNALGATKQSLGAITDMLVCMSYNPQSALSHNIMAISNFLADVGFNASCARLQKNADGSLSVFRCTVGPLLGTTAAGLVPANGYSSIAMRSQVSQTANVFLWVNGVLVLTLVGVDTRNLNNPGLHYATGFQYLGEAGQTLIDDVYCLDCSNQANPNSNFLGACRIFADVPFQNSAPIQWTPSAGANFECVDEIPPNGDTDFVSSLTVGAVDQYDYNGGSIPVGSQIPAVQHVLDMKVDSGSRSVASDALGTVNATDFALSNDYVMYTTPYDLNPATGLPWVAGDFPAAFGPAVTA